MVAGQRPLVPVHVASQDERSVEHPRRSVKDGHFYFGVRLQDAIAPGLYQGAAVRSDHADAYELYQRVGLRDYFGDFSMRNKSGAQFVVVVLRGRGERNLEHHGCVLGLEPSAQAITRCACFYDTLVNSWVYGSEQGVGRVH